MIAFMTTFDVMVSLSQNRYTIWSNHWSVSKNQLIDISPEMQRRERLSPNGDFIRWWRWGGVRGKWIGTLWSWSSEWSFCEGDHDHFDHDYVDHVDHHGDTPLDDFDNHDNDRDGEDEEGGEGSGLVRMIMFFIMMLIKICLIMIMSIMFIITVMPH